MTTYYEMPSPLKVNQKKFDLNYRQDISPQGRGFIQTRLRTEPMWVAEYSTPPLMDAQESAMSAFIDSLEGATHPFLGFDPRRPRPYAYRAGGTWGTPFVDLTSYADSTLRLDGFLAGATITQGDYISFYVDGSWWLFRAQETMVANGSGYLGVIQVRPRPWVSVSGDTDLRLTRPCCGMKVIGGVQKDDSVGDGTTFTFTAVQFVDRSVA